MSEQSKNQFARILREEREKRQMTLEQMANFLGTKKQILSRYERGERNPKLITAALFAQKLGIPIEMFNDNIERSLNQTRLINQNKEVSRKEELLRLLDKHADAVELLEKIPEEQYGQVLKILRALSQTEDTP